MGNRYKNLLLSKNLQRINIGICNKGADNGFVTKDNSAFMAFGVMGGGMQPQGQAQIIVNMIDYGLDVQSAGDMARWRHEGGCEPEGGCAPGLGRVVIESGFTDATREGLCG